MPAPSLVVELDGTGLAGSVIGGKAAAIDRLIALGEAVPPSAAVTVAAYRAVVVRSPVATVLDSLRGSPVVDAPTEAAAIDEAFMQVVVPEQLLEEIVATGRALGAGHLLAVRSSATAEDLASASFAGQYRSFLDVDEDALMRAVRLTWASLWHPAPRTYRRAHRIDEDEIAMAVLLMRMVDARSAGVAFSVDPGGRPDAVRVESVPGLAEGLVSGRISPTVDLVPRVGDLPGLARDLRAVRDLAMRLEESLGAPQDLEWARDDDRLWVVQSRPITARADRSSDDDGFDVVPDPSATWTTAGIAELLPGFLPPLLWETNALLVEEALASLFAALGAQLPGSAAGRLLARVRGRAAISLDMLRAAADSIPGASAENLQEQYLGSAAPRPAPSGAGGWQSLRAGMRAARVRRHARSEALVVTSAIEEVIATAPELSSLDTDDLLAYRRRLVDLGARAMSAEVAAAAAAVGAYRRLEVMLDAYVTPDEAVVAAQRLTTGATGAGTAARWSVLAERIRSSPRLLRAIEAGRSDAEVEARLRTIADGLDVLHDLAALDRQIGSTAVFGGPTLAEQAGAPWQWLRAALAAPARPANPAAGEPDVVATLTSTTAWRRRRILGAWVIDVPRHILAHHVLEAGTWLRLREEAKAALLRLGGEVRRVHLELGSRLTALGALDRPEDVDLLISREIAAAIGGKGPTPAEIAARRRRGAQARAGGPLPLAFTGRPSATEVEPRASDVLRGWAASGGRHRGRARVLQSPSVGALAQGDVLVARTTDASWSPLFLTAGAIVVEEGGPLSHAAIVARELGVPAVLNVPGVVALLANGPMVTVDGSAGTVAVEEPDPPDVATSGTPADVEASTRLGRTR